MLRVFRFFSPCSGRMSLRTSLVGYMHHRLSSVRLVGARRSRIQFIFAVVGEEFGLIACLIIIALFCFIILRGFSNAARENNLFILLAVTGLLTQFALQTLINMASTVNLMPPKGMTLPFISYGGSSTLALGLALGMVLALTRSRPGRGGGI